MASPKFAHSIVKGALVGIGSLIFPLGGKYPSLLLITEGLRRLEMSFSKEVEAEKEIVGWEQRGYNTKQLRGILRGKKAEDALMEITILRNHIAVADALRQRLSYRPWGERTEFEQMVMREPWRAGEITRQYDRHISSGLLNLRMAV